MIKQADVGVGIRGVEGTSAVASADYAIRSEHELQLQHTAAVSAWRLMCASTLHVRLVTSQFAFLERLLSVHGRLNYYRISLLCNYIFYKASFLVCHTSIVHVAGRRRSTLSD